MNFNFESVVQIWTTDYQVKLYRKEFYYLERSLNYLPPVQILNYRCKSSWFLNFESVQWFKFELAVDSKQFSSTSLHLIPIGPDLMNNETWLNRIDVVQPILLVKPAHKISGSNMSAQFSYTLLNLGLWTNRLI